MKHSILILALAIVGCPARPPAPEPDVVVTPPDDGDASDLDGAKRSPGARVCAHLKTLGCSEGFDPSCEAVFAHAHGALTDLHTNCLLAATSKDAVHACKSVACQ